MSEEWYPGQTYVHKHNANIRRAEERAMAKNQDYKTDLYADLRDFDKAVEYVRACAIEGALDIALRDVLAANAARPTSQASSEIREAVTRETLEHWLRVVKSTLDPDGWDCDAPELRRMREQLETALAPSRQGAGGK